MGILNALAQILSQVLLIAIIVFLLVVLGNMLRDGKGRRTGGGTYTGIIHRGSSDPLALDIWEFLTGDRRWGIAAPHPRVIDRAALALLDDALAAEGRSLADPWDGGRSPAEAYLTERFPALLPKGWRATVSSGPAGVRVRLTTGGAPEFSSTYHPDADVSAVALFDLCQSLLTGVGARHREPRDPVLNLSASGEGLAG